MDKELEQIVSDLEVTDEEYDTFIEEMYARHKDPIDRFSLKRIDREAMSMVHWQRDSLAVVHFDTSRGGPKDKPYKCSVLLLNTDLQPYKGIYPFEMYLRFGDGEKCPSDQLPFYENGASYKTFIRMFDKWCEKAQLGVTPFGAPCKILPLFANEQQLFIARNVWTPEVFDTIFEKPYRILTNFAAYENDKAVIQGKSRVRFGKHTYTQMGARFGNLVDPQCHGLVRALHIAKIYKILVEKSLV